jgi:hypothetical protein
MKLSAFKHQWAGAASATDIAARLMGQWLSERLGQAFIIENRNRLEFQPVDWRSLGGAEDGVMIEYFKRDRAAPRTLQDLLDPRWRGPHRLEHVGNRRRRRLHRNPRRCLVEDGARARIDIDDLLARERAQIGLPASSPICWSTVPFGGTSLVLIPGVRK